MVETNEGYDEFANFQEREFSVENILFITEYIQLKHKMINEAQLVHKIEAELKLDFDVNLPKSIPISAIANKFDGVNPNESLPLHIICIVNILILRKQ